MKKIILIIGIIFLLIGVSIIPSTGNMVLKGTSHQIILDKPFDERCIRPALSCLPKSIDCSKKLSFEGKLAYGYDLLGGYGQCYFRLDDPGNITYYWGRGSPPELTGGTWTNDGRWLCCEWNGIIWEIDPEDGDLSVIGGGGDYLNGLADNPVNNRIYGASSDCLYEINRKTGELSYIGDFGISFYIVGLAFDKDGVLYGWDVKYEGDSYLYTINITTGQATQVGSLGLTLCYAQDGAFDHDTDTLYLSAYVIEPFYGGYLIECDEDTCNCTIIGSFGDWVEIDALAIPYNWSGPNANFTWTPIYSDPNETILFDASISYDPDGYITLYEWDWDDDGVFDVKNTSPIATHSWSNKGIYPVSLKVTDNTGLNMTRTKKVIVDHPPNPPEIKGPKYVKKGDTCNYSVKGTDPDGDDLNLFFVRWPEGWGVGLGGQFPSGTIKYFHHTWNNNGTFIIRAKVRDVYDVSSDWTEFEVKVTNDKSTSTSLLLRFLERFPLLNLLLHRLTIL
jgi:hypothetical protein